MRAALGLITALASLLACSGERGRSASSPTGAGGTTAGAAASTDGAGATGGAGAGGAGATGVSSPGCGKPAHDGAARSHVRAHGRDRAYTLVVPDGYSPSKPYPLVFVLHGSGGTAATVRAQTDLEKVAGGRAVFAYPEASGGSWALDAPANDNADVALFDAILLAAHNGLCVDPRRVFVTGFSNGAYMANQLACSRGERIRGVVTHAGGGPYDTHGSYDETGHLVCAGKAVASLVVHGDHDNVVAPSEGEKSVAHWSHANRCSAGTEKAWIAPCVALQGCYQPVGVCRIPSLGHATWSSAGKVTWAFFEALH